MYTLLRFYETKSLLGHENSGCPAEELDDYGGSLFLQLHRVEEISKFSGEKRGLGI